MTCITVLLMASLLLLTAALRDRLAAAAQVRLDAEYAAPMAGAELRTDPTAGQDMLLTEGQATLTAGLLKAEAGYAGSCGIPWPGGELRFSEELTHFYDDPVKCMYAAALFREITD